MNRGSGERNSNQDQTKTHNLQLNTEVIPVKFCGCDIGSDDIKLAETCQCQSMKSYEVL